MVAQPLHAYFPRACVMNVCCCLSSPKPSHPVKCSTTNAERCCLFSRHMASMACYREHVYWHEHEDGSTGKERQRQNAHRNEQTNGFGRTCWRGLASMSWVGPIGERWREAGVCYVNGENGNIFCISLTRAFPAGVNSLYSGLSRRKRL